ncbi:LysR family transcriptional regulator [Pseudovibrio axinellae]|nr:LysR family transcriptional regulator [Pseudovibrio axinellae]
MSNITQLQTFVEVARLQSFAKASEQLNVPRSTITARVQAIEERLGVQLLYRTTRRVSLTAEGQRFLEQCEPALDALRYAENDLLEIHELSGTIRLSVPTDYPPRRLERLLRSFCGQHPKVSFYVDVSDAAVDLIAGHFDLAIRARSPGDDNLIARRYSYDAVGLFARKEYPVLDEINVSSFPVLDPGQFLPAPSSGQVPATCVKTSNFNLTKTLALSSDCIAVLPLSLCEQEVQEGRLVPLRNTIQIPPVPLYIVTPARKHQPRRVRAFIEHIVEKTKAGL